MNTQSLAVVLDELIPPSVDARMPGAGTLGIAAIVQHAAATTPGLEPLIAQGLTTLDDYARRRNASGFAALPRDGRIEALRELEKSTPAFMQTLLMLACVGYYSSEPVIAALNGSARPPHPKGYELEPDDLSALDTVRARGKIYREC